MSSEPPVVWLDTANRTVDGEDAAPARAASHDEFVIAVEDWTNETANRDDPGLISRVQSLREHLLSSFEVVHDYEYLGIIVVRSQAADVQRLDGLSGLKFALKFPTPVAPYQPLLKALDALHNQALFQTFQCRGEIAAGRVFPNEDYEGGIYPAGDYPTSPLAKHVTQLRRPCASLPAWMPVINLSLGPKRPLGYSPLNLAIDRLSMTHLITIAAGNGGPAMKAPNINSLAPDFGDHLGVICVGATANASGTDLAGYSSTGIPGNNKRRPCVVANGQCAIDADREGTSYAAPRVAALACLIFDAVFQVSRVATFSANPDTGFGIPLVGWGMVDEAQASLGVCYARDDLNAMPFLGVREDFLAEVFQLFRQHDREPRFLIHGRPVRQVVLRSARPLPGYAQHEVGEGFVCERAVLDYLGEMRLAEWMELFCPSVPSAMIPPEIGAQRVFVREELDELARIANAARPVWTYDYTVPQFGVNRISADGDSTRLPLSGSAGHALEVAAAARWGR